jgi:hypothetical protein
LWWARSVKPTISGSSFTRLALFSLGTPKAIMGSSTFSAAVNVGIKFNVWNMGQRSSFYSQQAGMSAKQ